MKKQESPEKTIHSWFALVIYLVVLTAAFVWATFKPVAPFEVFAWSSGAVVAAYFGKRLVQRKYPNPYASTQTPYDDVDEERDI
jgi:membrane protein implicated in regulation of membrane protease activity